MHNKYLLTIPVGTSRGKKLKILNSSFQKRQEKQKQKLGEKGDFYSNRFSVFSVTQKLNNRRY